MLSGIIFSDFSKGNVFVLRMYSQLKREKQG